MHGHSVARLTLIAGMLLAVSLAEASERLPIAPTWRVQPAAEPGTPPVDADWSPPTGNYRNAKRKGLSWEQTKWGDLHNLWLKTAFEVPDTWTAKPARYRIDFERINGNAVVFLNNRRVGERPGPYGDLDVTGFVVPGVNELLVFNTRDYTGVSRTLDSDPLRRAARGPGAAGGELKTSQWALGIDAPLYLVRRPSPVAIADAFAVTSFREKKITFKLELDADADTRGLTVDCEILDADRKPVLAFAGGKLAAARGTTAVELSHAWPDPRLWELDDGYCHTAVLTLKDASGAVLDVDRFDFGFREVWTEGRHLMLNGHIARFRVEWSSFGINKDSLTLLKQLGRNMVYYQSNPTGWWRSWAEVFHFEQDQLDLLDRAGVAVLLPVPTANYGRARFLDDPAFQKQHEEESERFIRRYRRHPSILAWCVAMNSFNPRDGIHPETIGVRKEYSHIQAKALDHVLAQTKRLDPTRLAYAHADGNLGDLASGNVYPNFAPVQESEDWPELWARSGDMPWWACEFAAVYDGSYWKGAQFLLTEFAAINFGPEAYQRETGEQLAKTLELSVHPNRRHGAPMVAATAYSPLYWDVQRLYVEAMDRAWRTWGVLGWHYFNFNVGYGDNPEFKGKRPFGRYASMTAPVSGRPDWANPQFDYHAKNMQPLLAYVGGAPVHTDKTHAWHSGEAAQKQLVAVWDGPGDLSLSAKWTVLDARDHPVASGQTTFQLKPGDIRMEPIAFTAPDVKQRGDFTLRAEFTPSGNRHAARTTVDRFAFQVFPRPPATPQVARSVRLYDPANRSAWVGALIPSAKPFDPKNASDRLTAEDTLVIGREALSVGQNLPFDAALLRDGLRVVVLEQFPAVWEALGFRNIDPAPRVVFPGMASSALLDGLAPEDLRYWRGTPDLTPAFKHARAYDLPIAPKAGNRNAVASTVMEIPAAVGFEPLLVCEFDLAYSPLLRYRDGKGALYFSSLDFTGRVGSDPAASRLAANLLDLATAPETPFAAATVYVNLSPEALAAKGLKSAEKTLRRAATPQGELSGVIGPELLRWRDALTVNAIDGGDADGLLLVRKAPDGTKEIFVQAEPGLLSNRYPDSKEKQEAIRLSVLRLEQLVNRVKTYAGAAPDPAVTERLLKVRKGAAYAELGAWTVFGPFAAGKAKPADALARKYPGEDQAIAGDTNPNFTWKNEAGKTLDFRDQAAANPDGYIDLARALAATGDDAVGFAVKEVHSDEDRKAILRLGVDYYMHVYVNGKLAYVQDTGHASPKPNVFRVKINLKKGVNVITLKILNGQKGFGFWANLSEPDAQVDDASNQAPELLYNPNLRVRNPYEYAYW